MLIFKFDSTSAIISGRWDDSETINCCSHICIVLQRMQGHLSHVLFLIKIKDHLFDLTLDYDAFKPTQTIKLGSVQ